MSLTLYWLDGRDGHRFSPFSWRIRMALAHKGLEPELVAVKFTGKERIAFSGQGLVPVLTDGDKTVSDSWAIACYLEDAYAEAPALFDGDISRGQARLINEWATGATIGGVRGLIIKDVHDHAQADDQAYFRSTREARFGTTLEKAQEGREKRLEGFRAGLAPLRAAVAEQPFVCGDSPAYADYICFGGFMWARSTSAFRLLDEDDPVHAWRERMLDLFDGLAREAPGYPV